MTPDEKLGAARCRLLAAAPFYGQAALGMGWTASEMAWQPEENRTMGVRVLDDGTVECLYYPPFVERLPVAELAVVVQHELEHILRLHCQRRGGRDAELFNIAADMCVNGPRASPRIGLPGTEPGSLILPLGGRIVWIPHDWPHDATAEAYYERLLGEAGPRRAALVAGALLDDHAVWEQSTATPEEVRAAVQALAAGARERSRGQVPGHLAEILARLEPPQVAWEVLLRRCVGRHLGGRRKTLARPPRRRPDFGLPGVSRRDGGTINVVVDTSGSVSPRMLGQFFGEIDRLSRRARVAVLQWDHAFQGYAPYRPGGWRTLKVRGRGGTDMAAPFRWLAERRKLADVQILLTDGFCNWPEPGPYRLIIVIAGRLGRIIPPPWGQVVHMGDEG
jgi:predicted metal-dependent peptidase